jgi:hypothetical protein
MKLTTTGIVTDVTIVEFGDVTFVHPTIDRDISEFGIEKIRKSSELKQLLQDGKVTLKDLKNNNVTYDKLIELDQDGISESEGMEISESEITFDRRVSFPNGIDFGDPIQPPPLNGGNVDNYNPEGIENSTLVLLSLTANTNIDGWIAPNPKRTKIMVVFNTTDYKATFRNNRGSSDPDNRYDIGSNHAIWRGESLPFIYDKINNKWRLMYSI